MPRTQSSREGLAAGAGEDRLLLIGSIKGKQPLHRRLDPDEMIAPYDLALVDMPDSDELHG